MHYAAKDFGYRKFATRHAQLLSSFESWYVLKCNSTKPGLVFHQTEISICLICRGSKNPKKPMEVIKG